MTRKSTKAILYCRISRDPNGTMLGVQRQEKECRTLAKREGLDIVVVNVDDDVSAYRGKPRPGWKATTDLIERGEVGVLIGWHPDRFTRHPRELEDLVELLERTKVKVLTVGAGEYDLSTATGRMSARVVGAIARHESEHKSERVCSKMRELAEAGKVTTGGHRSFGYEADRITIVPEEADAIRYAAGRIIDGASLRRVCAEMTVPTVTGTKWSPTVIRKMLTSPRVSGLREHKGVAVADAVWPAILDRHTWEAVRLTLKDPERTTRRDPRRYLLTGGTAVTADGRRLIARPSKGGRRCYVAARDGETPGVKIDAEHLDAVVVEALLAVADKTDFAPVDRPEVDDSDLRAVEAELDELATMRGRGDISAREWAAARTPLLVRLEKAKANVDIPARPVRADILAAGSLRDVWPTLSIADQRDIVGIAIEAVVIAPAVRGRKTFDPSRVSIRWRA